RSKVELLWNDVNSELLNPESPLSNIRLRQRITALLSLENPEILISSSRALGDRFEYALLRVLLFSDVFYPELAEQCKIAFVELLESKQRHLLRLSSRCDPGSTLTFVLAHSRKDFIS